MHYSPIVIPILGAAIISLALAYLAWKRRDVAGAGSFALLMLALATWTLGYAVNLLMPTQAAKLFWSDVAFVGVVSIPTLWLIFAAQYAGYGQQITRPRLGLLAIVPVITLGVIWTNAYHYLFWSQVELVQRDLYVTLRVAHGPAFWLHTGYSYLLLFIGMGLIIRTLTRWPRLRWQKLTLLLGLLVPWVVNLLHILGLTPWRELDLTPFAFVFTGLFLAWSLYGFRLFGLEAVARSEVFERMSDGVIVLGSENQVVDLNPAAAAFLSAPANRLLGAPAATVLQPWPELLQCLEAEQETCTELTLGAGDAARFFDARLAQLPDARHRFNGWLILLHDITERKKADQDLQRRTAVIRTLLEITETISSTLNQAQVMDRIVLAARKLLVVDRAAIFLWNEERGELAPILPEPGSAVQMSLSEELVPAFAALRLKPEQVPLVQEVLNTRQPLAVDDAQTSPLFPDAYKQLFKVCSLLVAPFFIQGQFLGVLYLDYLVPHQFMAEEMELATALARAATIALQNARLYDCSRQQAQEITALYRASGQLLSVGGELKALTHQIVRVVTDDFAAAHCSILVPDESGARLEVLAQVGVLDVPTEALPLDGPGMTVQAFLRGQVLYAPDVSQNADYLIGAPETRSEVVFPLKIGPRVIGVLNLESAELDAFDERSRRILATYADHAALVLENAQLYAVAARQERQTRLLNEMTRTALEAIDFGTLLPRLADQISALFGAERCAIELGATPDEPEMLTPTTLQVPLTAGEQKLGALVVSYAAPHSFTPQEIALGEQAAGGIALALARVRALEVAERRAQEADNLRQATAAVTTTLDLTQVLERILVHLEQVVPYDSACVFLLEGDLLRAAAGRYLSVPNQVVGEGFPADNALFNEARLKQRPLILLDAHSDPRFAAWGETNYVRGWMGVPLLAAGELIGYLTIDSRRVGAYGEEQATQTQAFANQVATAVQNARLYAAVQQRVCELDALHSATMVLLSTLDLEPLLEQILKAAISAIQSAEKGSLFLADPETGELGIHAVQGYAEELKGFVFQPEEGYIAQAVRTGQPLLVADSSEYSLSSRSSAVDEISAVASAIVAPLLDGQQTIGVLSLDATRRQAFSPADLELLVTFAATATAAIRNARLHGEVQRLAITDELTGLYNWRGLNELGRREIERARRFGRPLACIMFDIDHFKLVNDTYGHDIGNQVLAALADRSRRYVRDVDLLTRYGGEEFVALLPEADVVAAVQVAERLRQAVGGAPMPTERGALGITISLGVAALTENTPDLEALLRDADQAMYLSKQGGRNRVSVLAAVSG